MSEPRNGRATRGYSEPGFAERVAAATRARSAALEKLKAKPKPDAEELARRAEIAKAREEAAVIRRAEARIAREEAAKQRAAKAAEAIAAAAAAKLAREQAAIAAEAERKAARDARYLARKSRKR